MSEQAAQVAVVVYGHVESYCVKESSDLMRWDAVKHDVAHAHATRHMMLHIRMPRVTLGGWVETHAVVWTRQRLEQESGNG